MFNLLETKVIRDLNPGDINKLISVGGMVTRASTVIPDLQCASCSATHLDKSALSLKPQAPRRTPCDLHLIASIALSDHFVCISRDAEQPAHAMLHPPNDSTTRANSNCRNRLAVFQCETCSNEVMVPCDRGRIDEPATCNGCAGKFTMKLLHNRCGFMNKQLIKMQVRASSSHC